MSRKCIKVFRVAQTGAWKPEEISLLERLLGSKATVLKNDCQNIFFCDIDFTDLNVGRIQRLLSANRFIPEFFQVCESELPDLSLQEEEKSRTIIVRISTDKDIAFDAFFDDTPDIIGHGRSEKEAVGSLIFSCCIPRKSFPTDPDIPAQTSLGINIIWGRDSATFDYLADIKGHGAFHDSDGNPLIP